MQENEERPPPIFNGEGVVNLALLIFAALVCYFLFAKPAGDFVRDWLQSDQLDRPKDQQRLP
jgi:hypothetical protein